MFYRVDPGDVNKGTYIRIETLVRTKDTQEGNISLGIFGKPSFCNKGRNARGNV